MNYGLIKTLSPLALFLSFFFIRCSNTTRSINDEIVIKIGDFTVTRQLYENQQRKLLTMRDELTKEEASLFLLDSYISAGLLIESAKKRNYYHRKEFIEQDSLYQEELIVRYSKYRRAKENKLHPIDLRPIGEVFYNEIRIDYIRIPKKHQVLSKLMFEYLGDEATVPSILKNPESAGWNSNGLSFYEDVSLKQAVLPYKVLRKVISMQDDEVKVIKAKSAWYIVRFLQSMKLPEPGNDPGSVLQNILMAQSLEEGDVVFDPYRLKNAVKCNETLLSKIDFSIPPFRNQQGPDNNFVAELSGQLISENDIKEKIAVLPIKIQSLFMNKSTRTKAIATLILLDYCQKNKNIAGYAALKKTADWLSPGKLTGFDSLKFNFGVIGKMEVVRKDTIPDYLILAWSGNWRLTVKDFKNELDKLTPETRFDIVNNNLSAQMITYLAKRDSGISFAITIRSNLFDSMDLVGRSYDLLNGVIEETDIVGKLGNITLSVSELRELCVKLPETERMKFLEPFSRKEVFNEIMIRKCWRNLYDRKIIEDDPNFKKEVSDHQNRLLAQLFYESEIQVKPVEVDDDQLNLKNRQAVDVVNEQRLKDFLQTVAPDYPIRVNMDYIQNQLNVNESKYSSQIQNLNP
jgi:hypothetical protein